MFTGTSACVTRLLICNADSQAPSSGLLCLLVTTEGCAFPTVPAPCLPCPHVPGLPLLGPHSDCTWWISISIYHTGLCLFLNFRGGQVTSPCVASLGRWFSAWRDLVSQDTWQCLETFLLVTPGPGGAKVVLLAPSGGQTGMACV